MDTPRSTYTVHIVGKSNKGLRFSNLTGHSKFYISVLWKIQHYLHLKKFEL